MQRPARAVTSIFVRLEPDRARKRVVMPIWVTQRYARGRDPPLIAIPSIPAVLGGLIYLAPQLNFPATELSSSFGNLCPLQMEGSKEGFLAKERRIGRPREYFFQLDFSADTVCYFTDNVKLGPKLAKLVGTFSLRDATISAVSQLAIVTSPFPQPRKSKQRRTNYV